MNTLEFEKPIVELERKIEELRHLTSAGDVNIADEIGRLQAKADRLTRSTYAKLTPAQKVQVARHPERPHTLDYVRTLIDGFTKLAGDRLFGDDEAMIAGIGRFRGRALIVMGPEKGHDTESRLKHNFGMVRPEGYRKAQRLMELAERFKLPILSFVDTSGAYPGVDAEARGQAEAIARSMELSIRVGVPFVSVVIGEGGSGGAIAVAVADKVLMLEHAIYAVISPEGCASILWRSAAQAQEAATAMKLTAQDLKELGIVDEIVPEPFGGAHRKPQATMDAVADRVEQAFASLRGVDAATLRARRRQKFLAIGTQGIA